MTIPRKGAMWLAFSFNVAVFVGAFALAFRSPKEVELIYGAAGLGSLVTACVCGLFYGGKTFRRLLGVTCMGFAHACYACAISVLIVGPSSNFVALENAHGYYMIAVSTVLLLSTALGGPILHLVGRALLDPLAPRTPRLRF